MVTGPRTPPRPTRPSHGGRGRGIVETGFPRPARGGCTGRRAGPSRALVPAETFHPAGSKAARGWACVWAGCASAFGGPSSPPEGRASAWRTEAAGLPHAQILTEARLSAQEVLENLKDRWYQADSPPPDLLLTEKEFLSFLHPEHSRGMLQFMAKEIIRDLGEAPPPPLVLPAEVSAASPGLRWPRKAARPPNEGRPGPGRCHPAAGPARHTCSGRTEPSQTGGLAAKPGRLTFLPRGLALLCPLES